MGTWVKETDKALYLMQGNYYLAMVPKRPSSSNPQEQVADVGVLKTWFARSDRPRRMTIALGTNNPEPNPVPPPPDPSTGLVIEHNGQLRITSDTFFKTSTQQASQLGDRDKVLVRRGTIVQIRHYTDVGNLHWLIDLLEPSLGDGSRMAWYVYAPHVRLGTSAVLTVTADTLFKLEPRPSTQLPSSAKVFVQAGQAFRLASFVPAADNHTHIELADTTLGPSNSAFWYVYNLHAQSEVEGGGGGQPHDGLQVKTMADTVFTLSPQPPSDLPASQKVSVSQGTVLDIEYYTEVGDGRWLIKLVRPSLGEGDHTLWYVTTQDTKLVSPIVLTVSSNTLFKKEPRPSTELPAAAKVSVTQGTQLALVSHLPAAGDHSRVELADTTLGPNRDVVWYAYNPHIAITGQRQLLQVVGDTLFKSRPVLSGELPDDEKVFVKNNTVFELSAYDQPANNHVKVTLRGAFLGPKQRNSWFCYLPDIYVVGTEIGNNPDDQNNSGGNGGGNRGIPLQFPGFTGTYYANDPIYWQTQYGGRGNFTWAEALHVNPTTGAYRRPSGSEVIYGILRIAKAMEEIRKRYGDRPIIVTSWYRDPATNAAVGGASQSRHLVGDALDFIVPGRHPFDVYADLDNWWGNRGGLASSSQFTHIDARGYRARWNYGN